MNSIKYIQPQNLISQRIKTTNLANKILEKYCLPTMQTDLFPLVFEENTEVNDDSKEEHNTTDVHNINFYLKHFERILQTNMHLFYRASQIKLNKSFLNNVKEPSLNQLKDQLQNITLYQKLSNSNLPLDKTRIFKDKSAMQSLTQKMQQQIFTQKILTNITTELKNRENVEPHAAKILLKENHINIEKILAKQLYRTTELSDCVEQNLSTQNIQLAKIISRYTYNTRDVNERHINEHMEQNKLGTHYYSPDNKKVLFNFDDLKQAAYMFKHVRNENIIQKFNHAPSQKNLRILDHLNYNISSPVLVESGKVKNLYNEKLLKQLTHLSNISTLSQNTVQDVSRFEQNFNTLTQAAYQQQQNTLSFPQIFKNEDYGRLAKSGFEGINNNAHVQKIINKYTDLFYSDMNISRSLQKHYIQNTTAPYNLVYDESRYIEDASLPSNKTVKMLKVLNNLERKLSIGTQDKRVSPQRDKTVNMLQILNNLVYEQPRFVEQNKTNSSQSNKIVEMLQLFKTNPSQSNKTVEMLQILNNLVYKQSSFVEQNKTNPSQSNKIVEMLQLFKTNSSQSNKTVEMLQILNNLVYKQPRFVEQNKTNLNQSNKAVEMLQLFKTNSSQSNKTVEMLQVLNSLVHEQSRFVEQNKTNPSQSNKAVEMLQLFKTNSSQSNKTVDMLQVLNNLVHEQPRFVEKNKTNLSQSNNKTNLSNKTVDMLQVLNNLVYEQPRFVEQNKTNPSQSNKTVEMLQILNNLVHEQPRFVEQNKTNLSQSNKTVDMLQILNNLVHEQPRFVEQNKTNLSQSNNRKNLSQSNKTVRMLKALQSNKTVEMLQLFTNLVDEKPNSVEQNKTNLRQSNNKTNLSQSNKTVDMLQVLNNLAHEQPRFVEQNKTNLSQSNKAVKILQVLNNLVYQQPHFVENSEADFRAQNKRIKILQVLNSLDLKILGNIQGKTNSISADKSMSIAQTLQKSNSAPYMSQSNTAFSVLGKILLGNLQYVKNIGAENSSLAFSQSKVREMLPAINQLTKSYSTNKNMANHLLSTQQFVDNLPLNKLTYKILNTSNDVANIRNYNNQERVFEKVATEGSLDTPDTKNSVQKKFDSKMLQRVANLQNQVYNKFSLLYDQYFFTEQNPLSHRVYTNRIQHLDNNYEQFSKKHLQYNKKTVQKHVAVHREVLPLKYKQIQKQQGSVEEKQKHKKQKTTHIHIADNKIQNIATRVYKMLEKKMAIEKNRRGIF